MTDKELLEKAELQGRLELATGEVLDKIGCNIYCIFRKHGESDDAYRTRIIDCRRAITRAAAAMVKE